MAAVKAEKVFVFDNGTDRGTSLSEEPDSVRRPLCVCGVREHDCVPSYHFPHQSPV